MLGLHTDTSVCHTFAQQVYGGAVTITIVGNKTSETLPRLTLKSDEFSLSDEHSRSANGDSNAH